MGEHMCYEERARHYGRLSMSPMSSQHSGCCMAMTRPAVAGRPPSADEIPGPRLPCCVLATPTGTLDPAPAAQATSALNWDSVTISISTP